MLAVALTVGACSKEEPNNEPPKFEFREGTCITEYGADITVPDGGKLFLDPNTTCDFYISDAEGVMQAGESVKTKWEVSGPDLTITSSTVGKEVTVEYDNRIYDDGYYNTLFAEDEMGNVIKIFIGLKY